MSEGISFKEGATNNEASNDLTPKKQSLNLSAFPNPLIHEVRLQWHSNYTSSDLILLVSHISGQPLIMRRISHQTNINNMTLDLSNLVAGIYIVQLIGEQVNEQIKIIKNQ
jgi:hypothetical protein